MEGKIIVDTNWKEDALLMFRSDELLVARAEQLVQDKKIKSYDFHAGSLCCVTLEGKSKDVQTMEELNILATKTPSILKDNWILLILIFP